MGHMIARIPYPAAVPSWGTNLGYSGGGDVEAGSRTVQDLVVMEARQKCLESPQSQDRVAARPEALSHSMFDWRSGRRPRSAHVGGLDRVAQVSASHTAASKAGLALKRSWTPCISNGTSYSKPGT